MALHHKLPPFDAGARFLVKRAFPLNGTTMLPGEAVSAADFSSNARLRQLYHARWVTMEGNKDAPPAAAAETPPPAATPQQEAPGAGLTAKHHGFGRWVVMRGEEAVTGNLTRAQAEAYASGALPIPPKLDDAAEGDSGGDAPDGAEGDGEGDGEGGEDEGEPAKP